MVKLITTNSQFNIFPILLKNLNSPKDLSHKNVIFCEEKISLYVERYICDAIGGTFNTSVYSFGNYLRAKKEIPSVLSKEGASMAIRGLISNVSLNRLNKSKQNLSSALFELIIQLKSAMVSPSELKSSLKNARGVLKEKLLDVAEVYEKYEEYLQKNCYVDQSQMLSLLPPLIDACSELENADVFIVGYQGFTAQIREIISSLIKKSKSITAILCQGENEGAFVNETPRFFLDICKKHNITPNVERVDSPYQKEARRIIENIFSPSVYLQKPISSQNIGVLRANSIYEEVEKIAYLIKKKVLLGECRYKDFAIAVPNASDYAEAIKSSFYEMDVPYFLDEKRSAINHPLVKLILSYVECFRKNLDRNVLKTFYSNPFFNTDKSLSDDFYNYVLKYDVNYSSIKKQFIFPFKSQERLLELEEFRKKILTFFEEFNVEKLLSALSVKQKCVNLSNKLRDKNEIEEGAVSLQIYSLILGVLSEMNKILPHINNDLNEFKSVFISGVSAIEISIIPQFSDAVFIGGFKEVALGNTKHVFCVGLVDGVPTSQEDGALLSDSDIDELEKFKVLVEPKIKIVNKRTKESLALALSSFSQSLTLSYPLLDAFNALNKESDVLSAITGNLFNVQLIEDFDGFLTKRQALKTFSYECGEFALGKGVDFSKSASFYKIEKDGENAKTICSILSRANKEVKFRLDKNKQVLLDSVNSPTSIEDYNKCPYRAFLTRALKITEREEGGYSPRLLGNFMHDIFSEYAKNLDKIQDEQSSSKVFNEIKSQMLKKEDYVSLVEGAVNSEACARALVECEKYCYKTYEWIKSGDFYIDKDDLEVKFGKGGKYDAIPLLDGKVNVSGKIDRIDTCGNLVRVVDYKTGKASLDNEEIFAGKKLQLFLYASALKDKRLVGAYYVPVSDEYESADGAKTTYVLGKTDGDESALEHQVNGFFEDKKNEFIPAYVGQGDKVKQVVSEEQMQAFKEYATLISEVAVQNMADGLIIASPLKNECNYCAFKAMCDNSEKSEREIQKVEDQTIYLAVNAKKEERK